MTRILNIIGAGHLGKTIGYLLAKHPLIRIGAICNTSKISSEAAIQFIGKGSYCASISELPAADITLIATPDDLIATTCAQLSQNPLLKPDSIVMHCSGSLTSDTLNTAAEKGCLVASIHPMRSFAKPEISVEQYKGTYCAMEGDKKAIPILKTLFEEIGSVTYEIDKQKKASYHAAGVFSSNYLVTLAHQALTCMKEAGVEQDIAMRIITNLMHGSVSNLSSTLSPEQSLTGPIQRGDIATIKKHIEAFQDQNQKALYASLGKATLAITKHDEATKDKIKAALDTETDNIKQRPVTFF